MKVRFSPRAINEVAAIGAYIARHDPSAAEKVVAEIEAVASILREHPEAGHPTSRRSVRVITVPRYPYRLFYTRVPAGEVVILRVRHASRHPLRGH